MLLLRFLLHCKKVDGCNLDGPLENSLQSNELVSYTNEKKKIEKRLITRRRGRGTFRDDEFSWF
jgi:hypothetical protein